MKRFLLLLCCFLAACASPRNSPVGTPPRLPLKFEYHSPDGSLMLRLLPGNAYTYQLIESSSGTILTTAASAIHPSDMKEGNIFRGTVKVTFSPDSKAVAIVEDVTDASPAIRYILIRRLSDAICEVRYLLPEAITWTTDPVYEFPFSMPDVVGLSKDTIRFRYGGPETERPIWINSIHSTEQPATSY